MSKTNLSPPSLNSFSLSRPRLVMYRRVPTRPQRLPARPQHTSTGRYYARPRHDGRPSVVTPKPTTVTAKDGVPRVPNALPVHPATGNPDWKAYFTVKGWRDRWFISNQQTARDIVRAMNLDDGGPPKIVIEAYPGALPPPRTSAARFIFGPSLACQVLEWLPAPCLSCRRV